MNIIRKYKYILIVVVVAVVVGFLVMKFVPLRRYLPWFNLRPVAMPKELSVADGFALTVFADQLLAPRAMVTDASGRLLVSESIAGRVTALRDADDNGAADSRTVVLDGLDLPSGLALFKDEKTGKDYLLVAERTKVVRYDYDADKERVAADTAVEVISLSKDSLASIRWVAVGPNLRLAPIINNFPETMDDWKVYASVRSTCDVCVESSWKHGAILEADIGGTYTAELAGGLRDVESFAFTPIGKEIWATELGRDSSQGVTLPDELNRIRVADRSDPIGARRYGWPFCYGDRKRDSSFIVDNITRKDISSDCSKTEGALIDIAPASNPVGLAFVFSEKWPKDWQGHVLVAYSGSEGLNAGEMPKVVKYPVDKRGEVGQSEDFVTGWLMGAKQSGQPTALMFSSEGALFISDALTGMILRVLPIGNTAK